MFYKIFLITIGRIDKKSILRWFFFDLRGFYGLSNIFILKLSKAS
jgi:hypothetical protein